MPEESVLERSTGKGKKQPPVTHRVMVVDSDLPYHQEGGSTLRFEVKRRKRGGSSIQKEKISKISLRHNGRKEKKKRWL